MGPGHKWQLHSPPRTQVFPFFFTALSLLALMLLLVASRLLQLQTLCPYPRQAQGPEPFLQALTIPKGKQVTLLTSHQLELGHMAPQLQGRPGSQVLSSLLWGRQRRGGLWMVLPRQTPSACRMALLEDDYTLSSCMDNHLGILLKRCSDSVGLEEQGWVCTPKSPNS